MKQLLILPILWASIFLNDAVAAEFDINAELRECTQGQKLHTEMRDYTHTPVPGDRGKWLEAIFPDKQAPLGIHTLDKIPYQIAHASKIFSIDGELYYQNNKGLREYLQDFGMPWMVSKDQKGYANTWTVYAIQPQKEKDNPFFLGVYYEPLPSLAVCIEHSSVDDDLEEYYNERKPFIYTLCVIMSMFLVRDCCPSL